MMKKKGWGYWKLNTTVLNDVDYEEGIKQVIEEHQLQFLEPANNWEVLKNKLVDFSKYYCQNKSLKNKEQEYELYILKERLQKDAIQFPDNTDIQNNLRSIDCELNSNR